MKKVTNRNGTQCNYIWSNSFPHWMDSVISFVVRIRIAAILTTICGKLL